MPGWDEGYLFSSYYLVNEEDQQDQCSHSEHYAQSLQRLNEHLGHYIDQDNVYDQSIEWFKKYGQGYYNADGQSQAQRHAEKQQQHRENKKSCQ